MILRFVIPLSILTAGPIFGCGATAFKPTTVVDQSGEFEFTNVVVDSLFDHLRVTGQIRNVTGKALRNASFTVEVVGTGRAVATGSISADLAVGGTQNFDVTLPQMFQPVGEVRFKFGGGLVPLTYSVRLIAPRGAVGLSFEDRLMRIEFEYGAHQIRFNLTNKSGEALMVAWNEVSFVSIDGRALSAIAVPDGPGHIPQLIAPGSRLQGLLRPSETPILPIGMSATGDAKHYEGYVGRTFKFLFPITVGSSRHDLLFEFLVTQVLTS